MEQKNWLFSKEASSDFVNKTFLVGFFLRYCCSCIVETPFNLRWPDTIYLHVGRLFSIQIFYHSTVFDCRDILEAENGMLEVY